MVTTTKHNCKNVPGRFADLVEMMPPRAIADDVEYNDVLNIIDQLMVIAHPTKGQIIYLETLVQLVDAYEAKHHAVDVSDLSGLDMLKYLLAENNMSGSDLARLLGVHASMGSKILNGDRSLTVDHLRKLAQHFKVRADLFLD